MMLAPNGEKLSKRHGSVSVQEYRERGFTPAGVLNYLVRFGWSYGDQEVFSRRELIELFSWERVNRSDGRFDAKKFADVAFEHLKRDELTTLEEYAAWVRPFLAARGLSNVPDERLDRAIPGIRERARTLVDAAAAMDFYFREPPELDAAARQKFLTEAAAPHLEALRERLSRAASWEAPALEAAMVALLEERGIGMKDVAQAARVAVTGRAASPPLFEVMAVLGRELTLERLSRGAHVARQQT